MFHGHTFPSTVAGFTVTGFTVLSIRGGGVAALVLTTWKTIVSQAIELIGLRIRTNVKLSSLIFNVVVLCLLK
jgi:hypothetical protein